MKGGGKIVEKGHVTYTTVIAVPFSLYHFYTCTLFVRERMFHILLLNFLSFVVFHNPF